MIASDDPGPSRNHVKPAILIFQQETGSTSLIFIYLYFMSMCVYINQFHKIFFTCRPCVMVSSEITSALASVLRLFSLLIDIWISTRSTEVECAKEMKLVFHASQRATSFLCRTEAMTIPGKWPPGPIAKRGFGYNARLKIQRRKVEIEWKESVAPRNYREIKVLSKSVMFWSYCDVNVPFYLLWACVHTSLPHFSSLSCWTLSAIGDYSITSKLLLAFLAVWLWCVLLTDAQCKTTAKADIVLLVDGSWSIGRLNFKTIRAFIGRMVGVFDIGPDRVQIGKSPLPLFTSCF